jgi:predicted Rossmann fold flavoprotein
MDKIMKEVLIIGGGAAGMMAAYAALKSGNKVTLIEKNEKLGKKIYITGKGRCNVTNAGDMEEIFNSIIRNSKFFYSSYYAMSNHLLMDVFENELNVPLKTERGNRVFPVTDKASDIINGLSRAIKNLGANILLNTAVKDLIIENSKVTGVLLKDGKKLFSDSVIVTTGGFSYQTTGSDGDGYKFAKNSGHNIVEVLPSLVPLTVKEEDYKELQGLALKNIKVRFMMGNKEIFSDFGEMLFTHFGLSGPVILSGSSHITDKIDKNIKLFIDLKPSLSEEALDNRILKDFAEFINKDFRNSLNNLLPKSMIPIIIERSKINPFKKVNEISKEERKNLVDAIKNFSYTITGTRGFMEAIITKGGVSVKDINPSTMESKIVKDLYFAGEVLDLDALTGGYNLQIAWSTGYLAGISA